MNDTLRCIATPGLFLVLPYLFRWFLSSGMTRARYALASSISLGIAFFLLTIMFVKEDAFLLGVIIFVLALIGGYLPNYLMYPGLKKIVSTKSS